MLWLLKKKPLSSQTGKLRATTWSTSTPLHILHSRYVMVSTTTTSQTTCSCWKNRLCCIEGNNRSQTQLQTPQVNLLISVQTSSAFTWGKFYSWVYLWIPANCHTFGVFLLIFGLTTGVATHQGISKWNLFISCHSSTHCHTIFRFATHFWRNATHFNDIYLTFPLWQIEVLQNLGYVEKFESKPHILKRFGLQVFLWVRQA